MRQARGPLRPGHEHPLCGLLEHLPGAGTEASPYCTLQSAVSNASAGQLISLSPCVDAGDPAGVPPGAPEDLDNEPRPQGGGGDVGADEAG